MTENSKSYLFNKVVPFLVFVGILSLPFMNPLQINASETAIKSKLKIEVVAENGMPLGNAKVYLDGYLYGETDKSGRLTIKGESPGLHTLVVKKDGYIPWEEFIRVTVYSEEFSSIRLKKYPNTIVKTDKDKTGESEDKAKLEIKVEAENGMPLGNAKVYLDGYLYGETRENGKLTIMGLTPGKNYTLKIAKVGFFIYQEKDIKIFERLQKLVTLRPKENKDDSGIIILRSLGNWFNWILNLGVLSYLIFISIILGIVVPVTVFVIRKKGSIKEVIKIDNSNSYRLRLKLFKDSNTHLIYKGKSFFKGYKWAIYKVLKKEFINDKTMKTLFKNEIHVYSVINSKINSKYVVKYLGSGSLGSSEQSVLILEYIKGKTLKQIIDARRHKLQEAIEMGIGLCKPLMEVHNAGYCHLDLKSEHFICRDQNCFALIDIGSAQKVGSKVRILIKSGKYSSKEQLTAGSSIDERSDIYSLGVILDELFKSCKINNNNSKVIQSIQKEINKEINSKMKNERRENRYQSVEEVRNYLKKLLDMVQT